MGDGVVERVGGGHGADENQHDETHTFLAVVGAVGEADASAGEQEECANPEGRRLGAYGSFVEGAIFDDGFHQVEQKEGADETDDGREE